MSTEYVNACTSSNLAPTNGHLGSKGSPETAVEKGGAQRAAITPRESVRWATEVLPGSLVEI